MSYASQVSIPVAVHQQARDLTSDDFPALNGHSSTLPPPGLAAQQQHQQQNVIGGELGGARGILSNGRNNSAYAVSEDKRAAVAKAFASGQGITSLPPGMSLPFDPSRQPQLPPPSDPTAAAAAQAQAAAVAAQQRQAIGSLGAGPAQTTATQAQTPIQQVLFSPADRYGLLGLLHLIRHADPDSSMLTLGHDLTELGLEIAATDNLHPTFVSPFAPSQAAASLHLEPDFHLPSCYNVQPPPASSKISNFSDETLFFIFYSQPRDAMQEMAAQELYKHNWRYHKDLRLWLTKEAGSEPTMKTDRYEKGSYIFFDPSLWERVRKDFVLVFDSLERRM